MRVALFSDVHGSDIALTTVLDDIRHVGVDATYCLGDMASLGPSPRAAIDTLAQSGCACIAVRQAVETAERPIRGVLLEGCAEAGTPSGLPS